MESQLAHARPLHRKRQHDHLLDRPVRDADVAERVAGHVGLAGHQPQRPAIAGAHVAQGHAGQLPLLRIEPAGKLLDLGLLAIVQPPDVDVEGRLDLDGHIARLRLDAADLDARQRQRLALLPAPPSAPGTSTGTSPCSAAAK